MIKGFDKETQPLSAYEKDILLPILIKGLRARIGKEYAVTNKQIVKSLSPGHKISDTRVRKIINYIRINDLVPALIATSAGYYIAQTEAELLDYERSLEGREDAIRTVRLSIERQRKAIYN
ncbi:hypothetical protein [Dysgonomonas sp. 25]|uniref:hypothetical protein n=1 Tax=Dysgonomonas sp. 25 TaxID=2302933 RepID=UPI0013D58A3D|nr:hypothetical protein [Dysgonomonas sp. 25]NDV68570.1 hypothetical protein [Dysgonomonas sp. 25]